MLVGALSVQTALQRLINFPLQPLNWLSVCKPGPICFKKTNKHTHPIKHSTPSNLLTSTPTSISLIKSLVLNNFYLYVKVTYNLVHIHLYVYTEAAVYLVTVIQYILSLYVEIQPL